MMDNPRYKGILIDRNNVPIPGTDFFGWKSRSLAVTIVILSKTRSGLYEALVEKRGPGCPDYVGSWCCPCGYLGWDETLKEAAVREVYEETGLELKEEELSLLGIDDDPEANRQNVTVRFYCEIDERRIFPVINHALYKTPDRGGEENEVDELALVPLFYVRANENSFAFGHNKIIEEAFLKIKNNKKVGN